MGYWMLNETETEVQGQEDIIAAVFVIEQKMHICGQINILMPCIQEKQGFLVPKAIL